MLYLSVSMIFGVAHHHSGDAAASHNCPSCAWQAGSVVDVPIESPLLEPPTTISYLETFAPFVPLLYVAGDPQSRGPPVCCS